MNHIGASVNSEVADIMLTEILIFNAFSRSILRMASDCKEITIVYDSIRINKHFVVSMLNSKRKNECPGKTRLQSVKMIEHF